MNKTAVNVRTQEQWDSVTEILRYSWHFNKWQEYKQNSCINIHKNTYAHMLYYEEGGHNVISYEEFLKLKGIGVMKYKKGDILKKGMFTKKVLAVVDEPCVKGYCLSRCNDYDTYDDFYSEEEIKDYNYKLKREPKTVELTLEEIAKLAGCNVTELKIKK